MCIEQISVFLENTIGTLAAATQALARAGVNLIALSIAETENFGIMRIIVSDTETAKSALREAGFTIRVTSVVAASIPHRPGGLSEVVEKLSDSGVSIEYTYSFFRSASNDALIIIHFSDMEKGRKELEKMGVKMLTQEEATQL